MCRARCLCVVIYRAINNLTCFFPLSFLARMEPRSGSVSIVVTQVYYPYYLPPAVAAFPPRGAWMMSKHFTQMLLLIFLMAPLKITRGAGNRCKCFQRQHRRYCLSQRMEHGVVQIYKKKNKKRMHTTRKGKSVRIFSEKMLVLKYDCLWWGECYLSWTQQCLKKCIIKILQTWIFLKETRRLCDCVYSGLNESTAVWKWVKSARLWASVCTEWWQVKVG